MARPEIRAVILVWLAFACLFLPDLVLAVGGWAHLWDVSWRALAVVTLGSFALSGVFFAAFILRGLTRGD